MSNTNQSTETTEKKEFWVQIHDNCPIGNINDVEDLKHGVYWVGLRDDDPFHLNPYLIVDGDEAILIDIGGLHTVQAVMERVKKVVDPQKIKYIIAHHQDPDVTSGINYARHLVHPDCKVVCHSRMSVLIKHFGAGFKFYEVDKEDNRLVFGRNRILTFAHTPYLHSPGAIVTYDATSQTVFSSDLFGGVTKDWKLHATRDIIEDIKSFHSHYMPSTDILQSGISEIRKLGKIKRIAPQHGSIIPADLVEDVLKFIETLPVGMYFDSLFETQVKEREEANLMKHLVENANVNFMAADPNGKIVYINPAAVKMFKDIEDQLPCKVDEIVGKSMDIFHKDPKKQRDIINRHQNTLPRKNMITMGDHFLDLQAFAVYDRQGNFSGPAVIWENVTEKMKSKNRDEAIKQRVGNAITELADNSKDLKSVSVNMSTVADETSKQANSLSDSSVNVSNSINSVVTSIKEMTIAVNEISSNASKASNVAHKAVTLAQDANQNIGKLVDRSKDIGKVIKVISSIAQQTNLLALNATIEAARAGDTGRGFAVVANAIKELAKQTGNSTEDITEKIENIQEVTHLATLSIKEITDIISQINDISLNIASSVEEQSIVSREISNNTQVAAKGVDEISKNITSLANAAYETSKGANDTQTSADKLNKLSQQMTVLVKDLS